MVLLERKTTAYSPHSGAVIPKFKHASEHLENWLNTDRGASLPPPRVSGMLSLAPQWVWEGSVTFHFQQYPK